MSTLVKIIRQSISCQNRQQQLRKMASEKEKIINVQSATVAVGQMRSTNDKVWNLNQVKKLIKKAKSENAQMLFLPECCDFVGESRTQTIELAERLDGKLVAEYKELARCHQMNEKDLDIGTAKIDLSTLDSRYQSMPCFEHRRNDLYSLTAYIIRSREPDTDRAFAENMVDKQTIFYESEHCFAFTNLRCVVEGHILVSTKRVTPRLCGLDCAEITDMFATVCMVQRLLEKIYQTTSATVTVQDGAQAVQTVPHVHFHVMPPRKGDFGHNDQIYVKLEDCTESKPPRTLQERMLRTFVFFGARPASQSSQGWVLPKPSGRTIYQLIGHLEQIETTKVTDKKKTANGLYSTNNITVTSFNTDVDQVEVSMFLPLTYPPYHVQQPYPLVAVAPLPPI
ncbi:nitrilase and fragile histidine triad fusion protein NitFhit-like [Drosophila miranda]|uniref:nitrilase and fragile histidine triad fusion protein NitFhit-like n=1 Tax=Drosophila miranda TaxID=7229 RepID=UPI00143FAC76|nr:nitrilase and fragile histidine triad fusion protein NitFhit-like [Drosophila miranda]